MAEELRNRTRVSGSKFLHYIELLRLKISRKTVRILHKLLLLQEAGFSSICTHLSYSFNHLSAKKSLQSESDFIKARLLVSSELIQILFWILLFVVVFSVAQLLLA